MLHWKPDVSSLNDGRSQLPKLQVYPTENPNFAQSYLKLRTTSLERVD